MAKRKNEKARRTPPKKDKELQAIYNRIRREFSAADLQKYTMIEPMVPAEQVLAEMEQIHRPITQKSAAHD
jgi:hypothetical protein